jgi:predicted transcriptional regulator
MKASAKTATIPSLRVEPELRAAAESVLEKGETLSAFVENAVKKQVQYRKTQAEFIARGLASREEARRTGEYYDADEVHDELRAMLEAKRAELRK